MFTPLTLTYCRECPIKPISMCPPRKINRKSQWSGKRANIPLYSKLCSTGFRLYLFYIYIYLYFLIRKHSLAMQCFNFKAEVSGPQIWPAWQSKKAIYQIYQTSAWIKFKKWADVSNIGPRLIVRLNNSMISIFLKFVAHWQGRQAHLLSCLGLQGNKTTGCYLIWPPYYCLSHMVLNWEWAGESHEERS